jgi:hypothetical protein
MCDFTILATPIVHECSKTHGAVEPLNKSLILKTQRLLNGGSSLHGSTQFETIFCFALNKKKTLQGNACKKFVSGYSKDYVVLYLSLV